MLNPRIGQCVQVWYRAGYRDFMPYHGQVGRVVVASRGKPRNHGVTIDGKLVIVPCGNLRKVLDADAWMAEVRDWAASFPQIDGPLECDRGELNEREHE